MYRFKPSHQMSTLTNRNRRPSFRATTYPHQIKNPQVPQTNNRPQLTPAAKQILAELKKERNERTVLTEEQRAAFKERMRPRGDTVEEKVKWIKIEKECRKGNLDLV